MRNSALPDVNTSVAPPAARDRTRIAAMLAIAGLAALILAQYAMQGLRFAPPIALLLGGGAGCVIAALWYAPPLPTDRGALFVQRHTLDIPTLLIALILAVLTWQTTGSGVYTLPNVALWVLAVAAWLVAWWPRDKPGRAAQPIGKRGLRRHVWPIVAFSAIMVVGAIFRFYRLHELPLDPTSDHAEKLLDINDLLNGQRPIFFPRNTGREPGQFYITFALMKLFGLPLQFTTLKLGTALIGLLAIPAIFLFARELAGRNVGLLAAALFAISKWPTNISRMGLRFPYGILPTALALWLLFRYLRRGDRRDALLGGVVIGLGLHGYISFRIVPLLVPLLFGVTLVIDRQWRARWRTLIADGLVIAATALLACLPLARYAVQHPDQVWYRVATRAGDAEQRLGAIVDTLRIFVQNNRNALLAFNWRGDETVVNAVRLDPFLDVVTGGALLAGVLIAGYRIFVQRNARWLLVVIALPVLLLPSTLSIAFPQENPSANRLGPVMPLIFTIAALPFAYVLDLFRSTKDTKEHEGQARILRAIRGSTLLPVMLIGAALVIATQQNWVRYFRDYDLQYRSFVPNTTAIAAAIRAEQAAGVPLDNVYVLAYPYWLDGRNIALALGNIDWQPTHDLPGDAPLPARISGQPMLFVVNPDDTQRQQALRAQFPDGLLTVIDPDGPGKPFGLYDVPAR